MKRCNASCAFVLGAFVPSLYIFAIRERAARFFDALSFWFFSFIFTPLPICKKRLG